MISSNPLVSCDNTFGYYETIAGGSGAGPYYNGISGVHTHMTKLLKLQIQKYWKEDIP